jgi:hypothetical protein
MTEQPKLGFCWCGCSQRPRKADSRFVPGHDERAITKIEWAIREDWMQDLSPALRYYGEERGLLSGRERPV